MDHPDKAPGIARKRQINRRVQGDLGEISAMEWLASRSAIVWIPLGHSPDVDLIAELPTGLLRVQVKTSTYRIKTVDGKERWGVSVATQGGNRSWSGSVKEIDPARVDYLFVLVGDGRRWFVPTSLLEASRSVTVGGTKYSEFEIEPGTPIESLVYSDPAQTTRIAPELGECPSGQREQTVNLPAQPSQVRILPPPSNAGSKDRTRFERKLSRSGQVLIREKRQTTIPKRPFIEAGLDIGDRMRVRAGGDGRRVFERIVGEGSDLNASRAGRPG